MNFDRARAIADAVMLEGYALYPYRASAPKNRYRWTFGTLAPRAWSEAGGCEPWWLEAQLLVAGEPHRIAGQLRFFHIERRRGPDGTWDEGVAHMVDFYVRERGERRFALAPSEVHDGVSTRTCAAVAGRVVLRRERLATAEPLTCITIRVENITPWRALAAQRDDALAGALASVHLIVGVEGGELLSAIDPPAWAAGAAAGCTSTRTYPVLLASDMMLCAPFILYDHPQLAPESPGDLCDATEIDELLLLRIRSLTDDEKRQARATGPRTAAIIDRADAASVEHLPQLHGAVRDLRGGEMVPQHAELAIGSKVRLRAPTGRTDAQDALYAGCIATIADRKHDVDGTLFYAVTIDDDPAAELNRQHGRHRYYRVDEVELP